MEKLIEYFVQHTDSRFHELAVRIDRLESKIDKLNYFKWKVTGALLTVLFIIELMVKIAKQGVQ